MNKEYRHLVTLLRQGHSLRACAACCGLPLTTVWRYARQQGLRVSSVAPIDQRERRRICRLLALGATVREVCAQTGRSVGAVCLLRRTVTRIKRRTNQYAFAKELCPKCGRTIEISPCLACDAQPRPKTVPHPRLPRRAKKRASV